MRRVQQADPGGRLHGVREGVPQGVLQVPRLQAEDPGQVLREGREALLREGLHGEVMMTLQGDPIG